MGGLGSGMGRRYNTKRTKAFTALFPALSSHSFPFIQMQKLPQEGIKARVLEVDLTIFPDRLVIQHCDQGKEFVYTIPFSLTKAHYGNYRYWMTCPGQRCARRCGKLYLVRSSEGIPTFACRHCFHLAYRSQNQTRHDRIWRKEAKLLKRLGDNYAFPISCDDKPKNMHWNTFDRIRSQISDLNYQVEDELLNLGRRFGMPW